jgi:protein-tyrosine phosphatase
MDDRTKILFVCLGNICRSPAAEGVMVAKIADAGLSGKYFIDSAAIIGNHKGNLADPRMRKHAAERGLKLASISRPVEMPDFDSYDYIIPMDDRNIRDLKQMTDKPEHLSKIKPMCSFADNMGYKEVPDPYYGGPEGFELVLDILDDACGGLLAWLEK